MAVIYLAVVQGPAGFNKLQVIKQLRPELAREPEQIAMFLNEARVSARINHPNVVQIHEIGRDGDAYFMAMEYVDGQTLERIFRSCKGDVPLRLHLKIIAEALAGLHTAHELKDFNGNPLEIVHRDVSPHNILVGYEGEVKVLDFGIAKVAGSRSETRTGVLKGKFTYMAPEQFLGQKVDRRTDVFAAGVMLWQAVTKRRLWGRDVNEIEVYRRVVESRVPRPREIDASIPEVLDEMVMKALATDPANRYQTADELRAVIEDFLAAEKAHSTARDLGALVHKHFGQERQATRTAIEERMRVAANDSAPEIPMLRSLLPPAFRDVPPDRGSTSQVGAHMSSSFSRSSSSLSMASQPSFQVAPTIAPRPSYRSHVIVGGLAVAATVAVLFAWRPWSHAGAAPAQSATAVSGDSSASLGSPSAPTATAIAVPAAAAPASTLTELTVRATPPGAKISVDGIEVDENPFVGKFVRDGASHRVRAEAQGFAPKSVRVDFSSEAAGVELVLERQSSWSPPSRRDRDKGAAAAASAAPPPAPPSAPAAAAPSNGSDGKAKGDDPWSKRKKPSFDSTDPWK
ncbi:protein kinase [Pendulispora albinea]|uniref:Protein kinase n=2 Tax=Pendulispora albinea TaxID=2741071 RepID=A0ABZ2LKD8_9BACT